MFAVFRVCYRKSVNPIGRSTQRSYFATQPPDVWLQSSSEGQWFLMPCQWTCERNNVTLLYSAPFVCPDCCDPKIHDLFCFATCKDKSFLRILLCTNFTIYHTLIWLIQFFNKMDRVCNLPHDCFISTYEKWFAYCMHIAWWHSGLTHTFSYYCFIVLDFQFQVQSLYWWEVLFITILAWEPCFLQQ